MNFRILTLLTLIAAGSLNVPTQTGGGYDLSHSVIATGGGSGSTGGTFTISGTAGQALAGTSSNGASFDLHGGFWFRSFTPTAASVSITGRVKTANGQGIRNARLTLTNPNGSIRSTTTSTFGYYAFDGVEIGHTYVLEIKSKRFTFADPIRIFSLQDTLTDMNFTAESR